MDWAVDEPGKVEAQSIPGGEIVQEPVLSASHRLRNEAPLTLRDVLRATVYRWLPPVLIGMQNGMLWLLLCPSNDR